MRRAAGLIVPLPVSPVDRLAQLYNNHLHLPDPGPLVALMGAVAANMIEGPPVWLMVVGAPSCGKTELLNSLLGLRSIVECAEIGGPAAFLSGSPRRDRSRDATGGLLRQVGDHGGVIFNDFTTMLSKRADDLSAITAVLRECYGGRWTRHVGVEGGRALTWTGKLALFAGSTGAIDQKHQLSAELGERWIYYRFDEREAFADVSMALANGRNGWRDDLRSYAREFFEGLGLSFGSIRPRRDFTEPERLAVYELASLAARCRSSVVRDSYSHEIVGAREAELPIRLASVLAQMLVGLDAIGAPERVRWRLLAKIALDSMPRLRRIAIQATAQEALTVNELRNLLGCSVSVTRRVVEDLELHEVVRREKRRIYLTPWVLERYRRFIV